MKRWIKNVHFVGIGGIGMSGIAEVLLNLGFGVSGSDLKETAITERLAGMGGRIVMGHDAKNVAGADVVVTSSAVKPDNPEVVAARYQGIPVIPRAEMLAELMRMKWGIAVAGSHGKTTATSMISTVLTGAGFDPTCVIGGKLNIYGSNAKLGQGEWMVAEADESDGSFLHLSPTVVIVTNVDREHMDHYASLEALHATFVEFMRRVPFYGLVVAGIDDPAVRSLIPQVQRRVVTYGLADDADIRAVDVRCEGLSCHFVAVKEGRRLGEVRLGIPGVHNAVNALASLAVAFELGVTFDQAAAALHGFIGAGRRFEVKGEKKGVMVIDDYGHHPTEIKATLRAARDFLESSRRGPNARLIVAFQPHRYSRTKDLWNEFGSSFYEADVLFMADIYAASEDPIPGISGESLCKEVGGRRGERGLATRFVPAVADVAAAAIKEVRPGDVFLTLGAGSIWQVGETLLALLEAGK
ncbi:MAG TPA: UDP-N-acetylmuramate--L-alanine ligase [bacterium]|nr:UDP-N-acetylmuramate--L-alanine ligase [bacterium]